MIVILFFFLADSYILESIPINGSPPRQFGNSGIAYDETTNSLIIFGGQDMITLAYLNTLYTFNLDTLQWSKLYSESLYVPIGISDPILYIRSDHMLFSLFGNTQTGYTSDILGYNLTSNSWSLINY